ncbi:MAG: hypothetical protein ACTHN4_07255 [Sphingomicrobium sp.]
MKSDPPVAKQGPAAKLAEREAKLAQALRANLRRRKGAPAPRGGEPADGESA